MQASNQQQELVRLLVLEHGMQKASELANVPYDLVRQWESRRKRRALKHAQTAGVTLSQNHATVAADNIQSAIAEHGARTKLGLSVYATRQAEHLASEGKLSDHNAFRNIAAGSSTLHGWNEAKQGNAFTLNVLNLGSMDVSVGEDSA